MFDTAERIRNSTQRETSARFAITSLIFSAIAVASGICGGLLVTVANESILVIFAIVLGIGLLAVAIVSYTGALVRVIAQFTINKHPISWVALVFFLLCLAGGIIGLVCIF